MPHWPKPFGRRPINYDLGNIYELLHRLDNPENNIPPVIHVAGTNGKGSTIAFMKHILIEAGYRVHVYTSPHLLYFNERIVLANQVISSAFLYEILEECRIVSEDMQITFFEGTTAAAFLAFSKVEADIILLETGLGGRLDATNVVKKPLLNIITPISLDHQGYLGNSIEGIAREKAGIIKKGAVCVLSEQKENVRYLLEYTAIQRHASVYRKNFEWNCRVIEDYMLFESNHEIVELPLPSLLGEHQVINAGTAVAALTILANKYNYNISYENVCNGLQNTYWPARLEQITSGKLIDLLPSRSGFQVFLDGAHNSSGAHAILKWARLQEKEVYFIIGLTQGRDGKEFLEILKPVIKYLCCICVEYEPRSQNSESIFLAATELCINAVRCESLVSSIKEITKIANNGIILICGSLFLAGDVMKYNQRN